MLEATSGRVTLAALDFPLPPGLLGVGDQLVLAVQSGSESGAYSLVVRNFGVGEREIAVAGALSGQAQAMADFQLGLEEVGLQPVDGSSSLVSPREQGFGGWASDALASGQACLVRSTYLGNGNSGVDYGRRGLGVRRIDGHEWSVAMGAVADDVNALTYSSAKHGEVPARLWPHFAF